MGSIANIGNGSNRTSGRGKSLLDTAPLHYSNSTRKVKLTLCSVERDLVQAADIDKIVDRFSALEDNRLIVLN